MATRAPKLDLPDDVSKWVNHPLTAIIPEMETGQFRALVEDIRRNGLQEPIVMLSDGRILDGRHRHRACVELGIVPAYRVIPLPEDDAGMEALLGTVVALNVRRRHLTDSQRALVAAKLKPYYAELAKTRSGIPGKNEGRARDQAAEAVGVSGRTVAHADKVLTSGVQELTNAVNSGLLAVSDAAKAAAETKEEQRKIVRMVSQGQAKTVKDAMARIREAEQVTQIKEMAKLSGLYDVIVADPPWQFDKNRVGDPTQRGKTPYPPMSVAEIAAIDVPAKESCFLWLWVTNAHLLDGSANRVLEGWGFTPKALMTWAKNRMGVGDWLRGQTEHVILAVRGSPVKVKPIPSTLLTADVREHSRKPEAFMALVEKMCPGKRLEMFSRESREGWDHWGPELNKYV